MCRFTYEELVEINRFIKEKIIYIAIATLGFLSSITTLFIDINAKVSIKWLLFVVWLFLTILVIILRSTFDLYVKRERDEKIRIIKIITNDNAYILESKKDLPINSLLSVYKNYDGYEKLCGICLVENIQENKLIAAKLIKWKVDFPFAEQKNIVFKTSLSISIYEGFDNE